MKRVLRRRELLAEWAAITLTGWLAAPRPVRAETRTSLMVGLAFFDLGAVPLWIAQDRQLFEKYGLDVTVTTIQGGARTMAALASGQLPLVLSGGASVITARSKGIPVTMIAGIINKMPYDFVVAKNIMSPAQLKGAKGAISGFGSTSEFVMRYALTTLGVDPREVTLLQVGNETARLAALESGQIQCTVLTSGLDLAAMNAGFKPLLKLYQTGQPFQQVCVAANARWVETHPGTVEAFLKAIIEALVYVKDRANEAAVLTLLPRHLPIGAEALRQGFELYRKQLYPVYPLIPKESVEFILRVAKVNEPATDFYDNRYVQTLKDAGFAATVSRGP